MDELGCHYNTFQVGMFVWAKVPESIEYVEHWIDKILNEAHVFITPGFIFGDAGNRYLRISLCAKKDLFEEALNRIKRFKIAI